MRATCFTAPDSSFDIISRLISSAKQSIEAVQFQINSPAVADLLLAALRRKVAISLLVSEYNIDKPKLLEQREILRKLAEAGALCRVAPQKAVGDFHARYILVDKSTALMHTFALTKRGCPDGSPGAATENGNRDLGIIVEDCPAVTDFLNNNFKVQCGRPAGITAELKDRPYNPPITTLTRKFKTLVYKIEQSPIVLWGDGDDGNYFSAQFNTFNNRRTKIFWAYMQYLDFNNAESLRLLHHAEGLREQGADVVRFLLQDHPSNNDARKVLERHHLRYRIFNGKLHAKAVIMDDAVILQTKDWTADAVLQWTDCGLIVHDRAVAAYFQAVFASDWDAAAGCITSISEYFSHSTLISPALLFTN